MKPKEEQMIHNLASRLSRLGVDEAKKFLTENIGPILEVAEKRKKGWMDSTDFQHELGYAMGGSKIFPSAEDVRTAYPCVAHPDMEHPCEAQRVVVLDADAWDEAWAKLERVEW